MVLVDIEFGTDHMSEREATIMSIIGSGLPERMNRGVYQLTGFSVDFFIKYDIKLDEYSEKLRPHIYCYGVADSIEQILKKYGKWLENDVNKWFITYTPIIKCIGEEGGWRWHKWGEYIGDQTPTTEYLADEPIIDEVVVFHIYEVL